jgi:hypothetical protein
MRPAQTPVGNVAALATFTVVSASSGMVYARGVSIDVAAGWTQPSWRAARELLELQLFDSWRSFPTCAGSR